MRYGRYGWSYKILRWSLGFVFVYIGFDILASPDAWIGFLPASIPFGITRETALELNAGLDIVIGSFLIFNIWPKISSLLAALHLLGILVTQGIDAVLVRDVGLMGAALALLVWPTSYRKKNWLSKLWPRKNKEETD